MLDHYYYLFVNRLASNFEVETIIKKKTCPFFSKNDRERYVIFAQRIFFFLNIYIEHRIL